MPELSVEDLTPAARAESERLFSQAAVALGAGHVHSVDCDPESVRFVREADRGTELESSLWS